MIGSYSGANDTYWARARFGYALSSVNIGPEIITSGNDSYDETRYGAFAQWDSGNIGFTLSGGYYDSEGDRSRSDEDGGYIAAGLSFGF